MYNFDNTTGLYCVIGIISYLVGSLSSAILVSKCMGLSDPRSIGSGNPGATNMLRTGSKKAALLTLVGDVLKGVLMMGAVRAFHLPPVFLAVGFVGVVLGHMYPVFFRFQGGKGVATSIGAILVISPSLALGVMATWGGVFFVSRLSSLSALLAAGIALGYAWLLLPLVVYYAFVFVVVLLFWRHRGNIQRLLAGTEKKFKSA